MKRENYFSSAFFFGFLSAFAMITSFFLARGLLRIISSNIYSTTISILIYISLLYSSYYYSKYDKSLRKEIIISSTLLWIIYFFVTVLIEVLK